MLLFSYAKLTQVSAILKTSSSELDVTSELEVLEAADSWIAYNYEKRSTFAKDLLLRIRLPLLSDHVLRKVLRTSYNTRYSSVFQRNEKCNVLAKEILQDKEKFYQNKSTDIYKTRYCSQNNFNILIGGGLDAEDVCDRNIVQLDGENLRNMHNLTEFPPKGDAFWVVNVNCKIYALIYFPKKDRVFVHKYSTSSNTWTNVGLSCGHDVLDSFSLCVFMDKIFIIGGHDKNLIAIRSCIKLNMDKCKKEKIKNMNEPRQQPASTIFQGRVVVSGGYVNDNDPDALNTVEAYDHVANTWLYMPNMVYGRYFHRLVAVRNKLFVFGGRTESEVFDSTVNNFVLLKPTSSLLGLEDISGAFAVGSRIFIFKGNSAELVSFDFVKNEWKEQSFEVTKHIKWYYCLKLPKN